MALKASCEKYTMTFKFDAGTSRGVLRERTVYFLNVWDSSNPKLIGIGEAGPLPGLSPEMKMVERELSLLCTNLADKALPDTREEINHLMENLVSSQFPSIRFALETALLDLILGGKQILFPSSFVEGRQSIPINGLIWMGSLNFMRKQIDQKVSEQYRCLKIKVGALDFESECGLLDYIRSNHNADISLRLDANGAFDRREVRSRLDRLGLFNLHSIEQPIAPGHWEDMKAICADPAVPIALDEELIGVTNQADQEKMLDTIMPQYIILKPTLLGGFRATEKWIQLAEDRKIGWWLTSALESNVGLNALAQFTASLGVELPQGLGTGQLYHNNLPGKLCMDKGYLHFNP